MNGRKVVVVKRAKRQNRSLRPQQRKEVSKIASRVVNRALETKHEDKLQDATNIDFTTGFLLNLSTNTQAVDETAYIGGTVTPTKLIVNYTISAGDTNNIVHVVVIQMKGPSAPTVSLVFQTLTVSTTPLQELDLAFKDAYTLLAQRRHLVIAAESTEQLISRIVIPRKKMRKIHYADAAGASEDGSIWLLAISDDTVGGTNPQIKFATRLAYKDA